MKAQHDLLEALDKGSECVFVIIDLSAAFETLDHAILIQRLQHTFGISGTALAWLRSYLGHRYQTVVVGGERSTPQIRQYGVPQGSVVGPKLYSMYTVPLGRMLRGAELEHHLYCQL